MNPIYFDCAECTEFGTENHNEMVSHILTDHTGYSKEEAESFATSWEEEARERLDAENLYRSDFFKRHGYDPNDPPSDRDPLS